MCRVLINLHSFLYVTTHLFHRHVSPPPPEDDGQDSKRRAQHLEGCDVVGNIRPRVHRPENLLNMPVHT